MPAGKSLKRSKKPDKWFKVSREVGGSLFSWLPGWNRTNDQRINSPLPYPASLIGVFLVPWIQKLRQGALNHQPVGDVLITHRLLREQQAFEADRPDWDSIEIEGLAVALQCFICLAVRVQHDIDDKRVGDTDVLAFLEPLRLEFLCRLVRQNHQRVSDAVPGLCC